MSRSVYIISLPLKMSYLSSFKWQHFLSKFSGDTNILTDFTLVIGCPSKSTVDVPQIERKTNYWVIIVQKAITFTSMALCGCSLSRITLKSMVAELRQTIQWELVEYITLTLYFLMAEIQYHCNTIVWVHVYGWAGLVVGARDWNPKLFRESV